MRLLRARRVLALAAGVAIAVNLWLALMLAPTAAGFSAPLTQRVFYFHVPAATAAYVAFTVTMGAGALYLWKREERWDRLAASSAEVGTVLTTIALFTGIVWSRVEFFSAGSGGGFAFALLGDAKVITTGALWLVFLGYLALRRSLDEEPRARLSAVFGILGYIGVPLSYLASRFSPHPDFTSPGSGLSPSLAWILLACIALWLVIFAGLLANRLAIEQGKASQAPAAEAPRTVEGTA